MNHSYRRLKKYMMQKKCRYEQFYVELQPLQNFYEAEEYHQHYLDKHPDGYCHITLVDLNKVKKLNRKMFIMYEVKYGF